MAQIEIFLCFFFSLCTSIRLPQTPVSKEPEARESESWGGPSALSFPVTGSYHNLNGITVNSQEAKGKVA
jgi:hypothetical protein